MLYNIFDSHAHYDDERFDGDRDSVLCSLSGLGVCYVMNAGSDLDNSAKGKELSEQYPFLYYSAGVHPHEAKTAPKNLSERLKTLLDSPKAVAIGEAGLDYHYNLSDKASQKQVFEEQLALSVSLDKPLIVHSREATEDTMVLLRKYRPKGVVHCFSGSVETAREVVAMGMYVGFTGVVTFPNARRALEVVADVPFERLLIETDCPYMAPVPYRGKRCDSGMLPRVLEKIAEIRGMSPQQLADITCKNACKLFGINKEGEEND